MMKKKDTQPKIYYNFSLDEKVPKDHLLRKINEAIDFSFIYPLVKEHYSYTAKIVSCYGYLSNQPGNICQKLE